MGDIDFPDIIETISKTRWKYITVRRLRKALGVESEETKLIRKLSNTLVWLEHFSFLDVEQKQSPKRYRIPPDFSEKTRDIIRIYRR